MSDWGWVSLAYVLVYAAVVGYAARLAGRIRATQRRLDELR